MTETWFLMLESAAYRHLLLNHLPLTGLAVAACVLAWAVWEDRWASIAFGLTLVAIFSLSALAVLQSGDAAYPQLFDQLDGHGQAWLDHHEHLAERWGRLLPLNGFLAGAAIALGRRRIAWRRRLGGVVLATSLASLAAAALVAEAGGKIRHEEFRTTNPPVHSSAGRIR